MYLGSLPRYLPITVQVYYVTLDRCKVDWTEPSGFMRITMFPSHAANSRMYLLGPFGTNMH